VFLEYKGFVFEELKAVEKVLPIHKAQLLSYMKLLNIHKYLIGILIQSGATYALPERQIQ
jgi:hypothetical protein